MTKLLGALVGLAVVAVGALVVLRADPEVIDRVRYPLRYEAIVTGYAHDNDLDPALLAAVIYTESKFDPDARSAAGALGLMQVLPGTARDIAGRTGEKGVAASDLLDPDVNVRYGSWYLRHLLRRFGDVELALAAYHAGPGNVSRWQRAGDGIGFPETRHYVDKVLRLQDVYARAYDDELSG